MAGAGKIDWRYTAGRRRAFLRVLAETYDVEAALEAGRLTWPDVCELRARHPDFAERIEEVIAAGYDRLETMLLRHSFNGGGGKIDVVLAQALLKQRRASKADAAAAKRREGPPAPTRRQKIQEIVNQLAPLKAALGRGKMDDGRGAGGDEAAAKGAE